ncbi:DUF3795 domain-containing protein [bacterium]|nr:DUF3795 domain-containing protein [bacterium]
MKSPRAKRVVEAAGPELIARCGMNCRLCHAYVRDKNTCPGCRSGGYFIFKSVVRCRILNCGRIPEDRADYCFNCDSFPCTRLKQLDKRYRTKYGMSMLENLENIRLNGVESFVEKENQRWECPGCGEILSVHKPQCLSCGRGWH